MKKLSFEDVKSAMESLGTYKSEYDPLINVYVDLWEQYMAVQRRLKASKYAASVEGTSGAPKKSYDVGQHESIRKDILAYSDRLKLNPKAMDESPDAETGSALEKALASLETG